MIQSQFIPYTPIKTYVLNEVAYVFYYYGDEFIKGNLQEAITELETVGESDGVILSFNKQNKNGIKLV